MEINLNADPEFRRMVSMEVRAALIANTSSEVSSAVNEGIRRAIGTSQEKLPGMITQQITHTVDKICSDIRASDLIRIYAKEAVQKWIVTEIQRVAGEEIKKIDMAAEIKKRVSNLHIHFTC